MDSEQHSVDATGEDRVNATDIFEALRQEVVGLHFAYEMYVQLFGKNELRVELLNEVAGTFVWHMQRVLIWDVLLGVARLLDRASMNKNENLVLESLIHAVRDAGHFELTVSLSTQLEALKAQCEPIVRFRHKRVAHRDAKVALGVVAMPTLGVSRAFIEDVLAGVATFMNAVQVHRDGTSTAYAHLITSHDGENLISALKRSVCWRERAKEDPKAYRDLLRGHRYADA